MLIFYARAAQRLGFRLVLLEEWASEASWGAELRQADLESATQADRLAEAIVESVLSGEFPPGLRLDEGMLADRYGVSRTPVREALRQLASTGLIELKPRRGATVATATSAQLEALFGAMAEIEATCARLAAMSMTPIERRRLQHMQDAMAAIALRDDRDAYAVANVGFHTQIYLGAHNEILSDFAAALRRRLAPFRRAQFRTEGRTSRSNAEHAAVVKAILACDPSAAHAAMIHHMSLVEDSFGQLGAASWRRRESGDVPPRSRWGGRQGCRARPSFDGATRRIGDRRTVATRLTPDPSAVRMGRGGPSRYSVAPNRASNAARSAASTSAIVAFDPRSRRLVTPRCASAIPQGTMPWKCAEIGRDVDRDAVEGNPAAHANAERGDLVLGGGAVERRRLVGPGDPDADAVLAGLADDAELGQRIDQPALERADEGAHVGAAAPEVEHDIGDALPGPVIGELAAAPGAMHGKARVEQIAVPRAGSRRVERRMLEQPDPLRRASLRDRRRRAPPFPRPRRHRR